MSLRRKALWLLLAAAAFGVGAVALAWWGLREGNFLERRVATALTRSPDERAGFAGVSVSTPEFSDGSLALELRRPRWARGAQNASAESVVAWPLAGVLDLDPWPAELALLDGRYAAPGFALTGLGAKALRELPATAPRYRGHATGLWQADALGAAQATVTATFAWSPAEGLLLDAWTDLGPEPRALEPSPGLSLALEGSVGAHVETPATTGAPASVALYPTKLRLAVTYGGARGFARVPHGSLVLSGRDLAVRGLRLELAPEPGAAAAATLELTGAVAGFGGPEPAWNLWASARRVELGALVGFAPPDARERIGALRPWGAVDVALTATGRGPSPAVAASLDLAGAGLDVDLDGKRRSLRVTSGSLAAAPGPVVSLRDLALTVDGLPASLSGRAWREGERWTGALDLATERLELGSLLALLPTSTARELSALGLQGTVEAHATARPGASGEPQLEGTVGLADVRIQTPPALGDLTLRLPRATLTLTGGAARLEPCTVEAGVAPLTLEGSLAPLLEGPRTLRVSATGRDVPVAALAALAPAGVRASAQALALRGELGLRLDASIAPTATEVRGRIDLAGLALDAPLGGGTAPVRVVTGAALLEGDRLAFPGLVVEAAGFALRPRFVIGLPGGRSPTLDLTLPETPLDLPALLALAPETVRDAARRYEVTANVSLAAEVRGSVRAPVWAARLLVRDARARPWPEGPPCALAAAVLEASSSGVALTPTTFSVGDLTLEARTEGDGAGQSLVVEGPALDAARLARLAPPEYAALIERLAPGGHVAVRAEVPLAPGGAAPSATLDLEGLTFLLPGGPADARASLAGRLRLTDARVLSQGVTLKVGGATFTLRDGPLLDLTGEPKLELAADGAALRFEELAPLLPPGLRAALASRGLRGALALTALARGSARGLALTLEARPLGLSMDLPVGAAACPLELTSGVVRLTADTAAGAAPARLDTAVPLALGAAGATLTVVGAVDDVLGAPRAAVRFLAQGVALGNLPPGLLPDGALGSVAATVVLSGPLEDLQLAGRVETGATGVRLPAGATARLDLRGALRILGRVGAGAAPDRLRGTLDLERLNAQLVAGSSTVPLRVTSGTVAFTDRGLSLAGLTVAAGPPPAVTLRASGALPGELRVTTPDLELKDLVNLLGPEAASRAAPWRPRGQASLGARLAPLPAGGWSTSARVSVAALALEVPGTAGPLRVRCPRLAVRLDGSAPAMEPCTVEFDGVPGLTSLELTPGVLRLAGRSITAEHATATLLPLHVLLAPRLALEIPEGEAPRVEAVLPETSLDVARLAAVAPGLAADAARDGRLSGSVVVSAEARGPASALRWRAVARALDVRFDPGASLPPMALASAVLVADQGGPALRPCRLLVGRLPLDLALQRGADGTWSLAATNRAAPVATLVALAPAGVAATLARLGLQGAASLTARLALAPGVGGFEATATLDGLSLALGGLSERLQVSGSLAWRDSALRATGVRVAAGALACALADGPALSVGPDGARLSLAARSGDLEAATVLGLVPEAARARLATWSPSGAFLVAARCAGPLGSPALDATVTPRGLGLKVPQGEGAVTLEFGPSPVRLVASLAPAPRLVLEPTGLTVTAGTGVASVPIRVNAGAFTVTPRDAGGVDLRVSTPLTLEAAGAQVVVTGAVADVAGTAAVDVSLRTARLPLETLLARVAPGGSLAGAVGGVVAGATLTVSGATESLRFQGSADLAGLEARTPALPQPLRVTAGRLALRPDGSLTWSSVAAALSGVTLHSEGRLAAPRLDAPFSGATLSATVPLEAVPGLLGASERLRLQGQGTFRTTLSGTPGAPVATGAAEAPGDVTVSVLGGQRPFVIDGGGVVVRFAYDPAAGLLRVSRLEGRVAGGLFTGDGSVALRPPAAAHGLKLLLANVELDGLLTRGAGLAGLLRGTFGLELSGTCPAGGGLTAASAEGYADCYDTVLDGAKLVQIAGWGSLLPAAAAQGGGLERRLLQAVTDAVMQSRAELQPLVRARALLGNRFTFGQLTARLLVRDGVARLDPVETRDGQSSARGAATVDLARLTVNGRFDARLVRPPEALRLQGISVTGPVAQPSVALTRSLRESFVMEAPPPPGGPPTAPTTGP